MPRLSIFICLNVKNFQTQLFTIKKFIPNNNLTLFRHALPVFKYTHPKPTLIHLEIHMNH
uniref:Uncharacterized protein n=1 Tax=Rhizophora mucronata TaxID=61149 RepID=A0A2P2IZ06_RHIMU